MHPATQGTPPQRNPSQTKAKHLIGLCSAVLDEFSLNIFFEATSNSAAIGAQSNLKKNLGRPSMWQLRQCCSMTLTRLQKATRRLKTFNKSLQNFAARLEESILKCLSHFPHKVLANGHWSVNKPVDSGVLLDTTLVFDHHHQQSFSQSVICCTACDGRLCQQPTDRGIRHLSVSGN